MDFRPRARDDQRQRDTQVGAFNSTAFSKGNSSSFSKPHHTSSLGVTDTGDLKLSVPGLIVVPRAGAAE